MTNSSGDISPFVFVLSTESSTSKTIEVTLSGTQLPIDTSKKLTLHTKPAPNITTTTSTTVSSTVEVVDVIVSFIKSGKGEVTTISGGVPTCVYIAPRPPFTNNSSPYSIASTKLIVNIPTLTSGKSI